MATRVGVPCCRPGCRERARAATAGCAAPRNGAQVAVGIGDTNLAWQCGRIAVALDPGHVEALTNLGVLEWRKGADAQAAALFRCAFQQCAHCCPWPRAG